MSMLVFMPWCGITRAYDVGDITVIPFSSNQVPDGLDTNTQLGIVRLLNNYKTITGDPLRRLALIQYHGRSLIDDLSDDEVDTAKELVDLFCFCAMAHREYLPSSGIGRYCNADCFSLIIQRFDGNQFNFIAFNTRRRDGRTLAGWPTERIAVTVPVHVSPIREVEIDEQLLDALLSLRASNTDDWGRWQSAISCFNQANTDNDNVSRQMEWVLLPGAFEQILHASSNARDVASRLTRVIRPEQDISARSAQRRSSRWSEQDLEQPLRYCWMREFYSVRGEFAHGRLNAAQPMEWTEHEHLLLAAITFPLTVKSLLGEGYALTEDDRAQVNALEPLMDSPDFMRQCDDPDWPRLIREAEGRLLEAQMLDAFRQHRQETGIDEDIEGEGCP